MSAIPSMQAVSIRHGQRVKRVVLHDHMTTSEFQEVIEATFNVSGRVVGLEDDHGTVYPLYVLMKSLSLYPFHSTYSLLIKKGSSASSCSPPKSAPITRRGKEERRDAEEDEEEEKGGGGGGGARAEEKKAESDDPQHMLQYIQENTVFSQLPMSKIVGIFRSASEGGVIDRRSFEHAFMQVMGEGGSAQDRRLSKLIAQKIFTVFDRDGDGTVDFAEFVSGLSFLCQASGDDKIKTAFSLFDTDGDGVISREEMLRYMTSFFQVSFALDPSMAKRFGGLSAQEVGSATADHCFHRADVNNDGHITLEEFTEWCNSDDTVGQFGIPM